MRQIATILNLTLISLAVGTINYCEDDDGYG